MSKRNTAGAGSIRRRTDGRWEARYTAGIDPSSGKQIQRSIYGKTQQEVRQKLTKVTAEIDEGTYIAPSKLTVTQWMDLWLATYVHHAVKQHTYEAYERDIRNYIKPVLGKVSLSSLNALQVQKLYNGLIERGLSPKTVKNVHGVFHEALERAVKLGMAKYNPTDGTELPKVQRKPIHPLEGEAILAFLEAIKGLKYERLFYIDLFSGLREGEILGLTWDCVDFDRNQLFVNKQLQKSKKVGGVYELVTTKNSRNRTVTVAASVMTALKEQQQ